MPAGKKAKDTLVSMSVVETDSDVAVEVMSLARAAANLVERPHLFDCPREEVEAVYERIFQIQDMFVRTSDYLKHSSHPLLQWIEGIHQQVNKFLTNAGRMSEIRPVRKIEQPTTTGPEQGVKRDLEELVFPGLSPEERESQFLVDFSAYAKAHPKRAIQFAYRLVREAEAELPPDQNRTLGLREAARLISDLRGETLHSTQLRRYFDERRIQIGAIGIDGELKFSRAECEAYVPPSPRKKGRKKKNPEASS